MPLELARYDWAHWPPQGVGAPASFDGEKTAAEAHPIDLEYVVNGIATAYAQWSLEMTPGFEKTSATHPVEVTTRNVWRHPDAHPLVLTVLLLEKYGAEYIDWAPEVLRATLRRDGIELSNSAYTKILAARVLMNSPSPWRQWEVFHWVSLGLAGEPPNFHYAEEPMLGLLVAGFDMMHTLDPKRETGLDVDKYIAACFKNEGMPYIPAPLHFAQRELEERKLRCTNCGALHRDDNDLRCITCTSPRLEAVPYEYAELRDEVAALWKARSKLPIERAIQGLPKTPAGNATEQLLAHWDYAKIVRSHLVQQTKVLKG